MNPLPQFVDTQKSIISNLDVLQKHIHDIQERETALAEREEGLNKRQREIENLSEQAREKLQKAEEIEAGVEEEKRLRRLKIEYIDKKFDTDFKVWTYLADNKTPIVFMQMFVMSSSFLELCPERQFYISKIRPSRYTDGHMIQFELVEDNIIQIYSTRVYTYTNQPRLHDGAMSMLLKPIDGSWTSFIGENLQVVKQHPMPRATLHKVESVQV